MKLCKVEGCSSKHRAKGFCHIHYLRFSRRNTTDLIRNKCLPERFNKGYVINKDNGCWDWIKSLGSFGYAHIVNKGKNLRGHRVSYEIYYGEIPKGSCVLHKCDNRKCVNPEHLFLGSQSDNMKDMINKNRHPKAIKGNKITQFNNFRLENHPLAKLNCEKALKIHKLLNEGKSMASIARLFKVSERTIFNIKKGLVWKKEAIEVHHRIKGNKEHD